jgi:hypothetical protein
MATLMNRTKSKKRCADQEEISQPVGVEEGSSTTNKVHPNVSHTLSTLTVTYGNTTDSVKNNNAPTAPYMKNMFRGVVNKLRELKICRCSHLVLYRSSTNAILKPLLLVK